MMLWVEWFTIRIAAFDVEVFITRRAFCLSLFPVALIVAGSAESAHISQIEFKVRMRRARPDMVDPRCTLAPDVGAADGAAPAIPVQRHEPERTPSGRLIEARLHGSGGWVCAE